MQILVLSSHDYSNLGHSVGKSLRAAGVDAVDVKLHRHKFHYPSESQLIHPQNIQHYVKQADHVLIMHSDASLLTYVKDRAFSVYHTGTRYRDEPKKYNQYFKDAIHVLTDQTEFVELAPNAKYVVSGIDPAIYQPKIPGRKLIIGHFPSHPEVKGTAKIIELLRPFEKHFEIRIGATPMPWHENLKRIQAVDIYIELFKPELNGKKYGCFGVTALEAAMMGKHVITQDLERETYLKTHGSHPFCIANSEKEFKSVIRSIIENGIRPAGLIHDEAKKLHSYEATGNRLKSTFKIMSLPKVSVIIGHNNNPTRAELLKRAKASLGIQTYTGEIEFINSHTQFGDPVGSISYNLNNGIRKATGEYVKYLSDDDELTPNCIEDSVRAMMAGADFIHGKSRLLHDDGTRSVYAPPVIFRNMTAEQMNAHVSNPIHGGTTMFRRADLLAVAYPNGQVFDESLDCAEEMDLYYRLWKAGKKLTYVDRELYTYRKHEGQKSLGKNVNQAERKLKIEAVKNRYR